MRNLFKLLFVFSVVAWLTTANAADPEYRTDDGADKNLPWFNLVSGQFPPIGSSHYIQGELFQVDHPERQLVIRVDRNDSQQAGYWDLPLSLDMLPYGSIFYHGAPAALCDIPLGTHLHTWCYLKAESDNRPPLAVFHDRISADAAFRRCIRVEDDFSYRARQQQVWKIDSVNLEKKKLNATLFQDGKMVGESKSSIFLVVPKSLKSVDLDRSNRWRQISWCSLISPGSGCLGQAVFWKFISMTSAVY